MVSPEVIGRGWEAYVSPARTTMTVIICHVSIILHCTLYCSEGCVKYCMWFWDNFHCCREKKQKREDIRKNVRDAILVGQMI